MNKIYYNLKLEAITLRFEDANLQVSSLFDQSEINELIRQKLRPLNFIPDFDTVRYEQIGNELFVRGLAYEDTPSPMLECFII